MVRYISLLLLIGLAWGQTNPDKLVLKNGPTYFGEYSKIEGLNVLFIPGFGMFKPKDGFTSQRIPIKEIKSLELSDGSLIINNGKRVDFSPIEAMAFKDAQSKNMGKWFLFLPLNGTIFFGLVRTAELPYDFGGYVALSSLISYGLLKSGKKIEYPKSITSQQDRRTYKEVYTQTLNKKEKKIVVVNLA
ncbi:uncharacterized protein METZ01_LOCUS468345, partial [marine metagenome]